MEKIKLLSAILVFSVLLIAGPTASAHAMDVTLAWDGNSEPDLAGYKIYYGTIAGGPYNGAGSSDGASPITVPLSGLLNPLNPELTLHGLPEGTYYFVVTAYTTGGVESGYSNEVSTQAADPATPTNSAPILSSLEVNGQSGGTAVQISDRLVDIRIVASDDVMVSQYLILDGQSNPTGKTFLPIPGGARQNPIFTVTDFALNDTDGTHAIYAWVKDDQGVLSAVAAKTNVILDRIPTVAGYPSINYADSTVTITYSESNMRNAAVAGNYSFNNGLLLGGNGTDTSGTGKSFRLPLNTSTLQRNIIYTMQINGAVTDPVGNAVTPNTTRLNDDDNDGMADDWEKQWFGSIAAKNGSADTDGDSLTDGAEYGYARSNPAWGANRWNLSPVSRDSDGDGISDVYEVVSGLNPVSSSDRDLDLDNDGWSNHEEHLAGTSANDPNSCPQAVSPIEIVELIPTGNAGIPPSQERIPNNTAIGVRLESVNGIDMTDPNAVTFSVNDGTTAYTRKLNDLNGKGSKILRAVPLDADGSVAYSLWAVYYRSNETALPNSYPYDATLEVTVSAKDRNGETMDPLVFNCKIQCQDKENAANIKTPKLSVDTSESSASNTTVSIDKGTLKGASITYEKTLLQEIGLEPYFGPVEEVPPLTEGLAVGAPVNLLPPAVFPNGVTITIPCPWYNDVSTLSIYYYDGEKWLLACDSAGNVTRDGEGWMVPGSRIDHNKDKGTAAYIEIQVYHFSAAAVGEVSGGGITSDKGCFISALWD